MKLLNYLNQPNPTLTKVQAHGNIDSKSKRTSHTHHRKDDRWPAIAAVRPWEDFNFDILETVLEGRLYDILGSEMDADVHTFSHIDEDSMKVFRERDLELLLSKSHHSIISQALGHTSEKLIRQKVRMTNGDKALLPLDKTGLLRPDWAGISDTSRSDDNPKPNNILPGDTKTSWSFRSSDLEPKGDASTYAEVSRKARAIRQLLYYCCKAYTRYGYLITDKELVVIRISDLNGEQWTGKDSLDAETARLECSAAVHDNPLVEYKSIPWISGSRDGLTINLALWALHILAANNGELQRAPYISLSEEKLVTKPAVPRLASSFDENLPCSFEAPAHEIQSLTADDSHGSQETKIDSPAPVVPDSSERTSREKSTPRSSSEATISDEDPQVYSIQASYSSNIIPRRRNKRTRTMTIEALDSKSTTVDVAPRYPKRSNRGYKHNKT